VPERSNSRSMFQDPYRVLFGPYSVWDGSPLRELVDLDDPDIRYVVEAIQLMRIAGLDMTDPDMIRLGVYAGHRRASSVPNDDELLVGRSELREWFEAVEREIRLPGDPSVAPPTLRVYYARLGNRCKIGWTADLKRRMAEIQPEELLVTEPGGPDQETKRHAQFAELHVVGEWFRYEGALVKHVESLRR